MRLVHWLFVISAALFVFGVSFVVIGAHATRRAPVVERPPTVPVASVKQIMDGIVGPAAMKVYDAVGSTVSAKGVEEIAPKNDAEWTALGNSAAALGEAGNLLMMEGHAVDRRDWIKMSQAMVNAAKLTLEAVEAKSPDGILAAGSDLNETCDNCHQRYGRQ